MTSARSAYGRSRSAPSDLESGSDAGVEDGFDALSSAASGSDGSSGTPGAGSTGSASTGSTFGGGAPGAGGAPAGGGSPSGGGAPPPKQEKFTYEVDVDFGPRGSVRDFDGVATLHPLTEANPRLLFLGVADDAKRAAFSVLDTEVEERGDGECLEFDDRCAVLYLKVGEKHTFVEPDRDRYEIRLRAINEVRL